MRTVVCFSQVCLCDDVRALVGLALLPIRVPSRTCVSGGEVLPIRVPSRTCVSGG